MGLALACSCRDKEQPTRPLQSPEQLASPSRNRTQPVSDFERYIHTYACKTPVWLDGSTHKEIRCLSIPYNSKGRVTYLTGFEGNCEVIEIGERKHPVPLDKDIQVFTIEWPAESTDGSLRLTVLPNFAYLRTDHRNPNFDDFLWYRYLTKAQYGALERFFAESVKDGTLRNIDKSSDLVDQPEASLAKWAPAYFENCELWDSGKDTPQLYEAIYWHFVSASVNFLFDQANRYLPDEKARIRFPPWTDFPERELGIVYATYLEDMLDGDWVRVVESSRGVYIGAKKAWSPKGNPVAFSISNRGEKEIKFSVGVEFLNGKSVVAHLPTIPVGPGTTTAPLRLAAHSRQAFNWNPPDVNKAWLRGGKWTARLQLSYGEGAAGAMDKKATSEPFTVGYPRTLDDVFQLPDQREALLELYYRLKERQLHQGLTSLTPTEALLVEIWDLQGSFERGSWEAKQYFVRQGDRAPHAVAELQTIGAGCQAAGLQVIIASFPGGKIPATLKQREQIMKTWADDRQAITPPGETFWYTYDEMRPACKEDVYQPLYRYLSSHRADIRW